MVVALESISGMAGVGKTTLALNAAHQLSGRFPDGPLYVNLLAHAGGQAPLSSGEALAYLLRYAGVPAEKVPADEEERAALWRTVAGRLVSVIVLDDAAGPDQVRPLLPGRSPSLLIITSRRKLNGLPGTRSVTLDVLPPNEALALFRNFAGEERSRDVDDGELAAVVELCGFLPLAIKLVAHRFSDHPSWSVATLRDRLSRPSGRLREIRDGYIEIANAFDLSYRTLEPEQQRAFRLLGLHIGDGFDPMAAAALVGLPLPQVERMVELLHQSHLLQEPTPNRFCFHDLLGEYARTLADSEDSDEVRQASQGRLIDFLLHAADRADRLVYPRRPRFDIRGVPLPEYTPSLQDAKDAKGWLRMERTSLLAAEAHARARGDTERAALLSHVLGGFLDAEGRWLDTARMHRQAVHHWRRRGNRRALGLALLDLATAQANTGHYDAAQESCEGALKFARSTHDVELEAEALRMLGVVSWHGGRNQDALAYQEQALALRRHVGDDWHRGRCLDNIGISLLYLGQLDDALEHFTLAIEWLERSDDRRTLGKTLNNFGDLLNTMGKTKRAREAYERSLDIAESVGTPLDKGIAQLNLACVLSLSTDKGDSAAAESMLAECLEIFRRIGDRKNEANTLLAVGTSRHSSESFEDAESHARQALDLIRAIGAGNEHVQAQRQLGQAIAAQGRLQEGALHLEAALDLARRGSMPQEEATALQALAEVRLCEGHTDQARTLLRRAIDLLEPLDATGAAAIRDRLRRAN